LFDVDAMLTDDDTVDANDDVDDPVVGSSMWELLVAANCLMDVVLDITVFIGLTMNADAVFIVVVVAAVLFCVWFVCCDVKFMMMIL
jgi:hypothetical protein